VNVVRISAIRRGTEFGHPALEPSPLKLAYFRKVVQVLAVSQASALPVAGIFQSSRQPSCCRTAQLAVICGRNHPPEMLCSLTVGALTDA
jgi:hypothetical protein